MTMGRRKDSSLVTYDEARNWAQVEHIDSRKQYWVWIDREQPIGLPKYPNRVYAEWDGWPSFLNNDNEFANANPHQYRPFNEALVYAHASGIMTAKQWFAHQHPDDIPVRPEFVYRGYFLGWRSFLGTGRLGLAHKLEVKQQGEEMGVLALVVSPGNQNNVIRCLVGPGREAVMDNCTKHNIRVLKMYHLDEGYDWKAVIDTYGSSQGDDEWIVSNVNELLWQLSNDLLFV